MSRHLQSPHFSTSALVALCSISVIFSWAAVEVVAWALTHAIEWMTGSSAMQDEEYVGVALVKIVGIACLSWALIVGFVFWVML